LTAVMTSRPELQAYHKPMQLQLEAFGFYSLAAMKNPEITKAIVIRGDSVPLSDELNQASKAIIATHKSSIKSKEDLTRVTNLAKMADQGNLSYGALIAHLDPTTKVDEATIANLAGAPSQVMPMLSNNDALRGQREQMKVMFEKGINAFVNQGGFAKLGVVDVNGPYKKKQTKAEKLNARGIPTKIQTGGTRKAGPAKRRRTEVGTSI